MTFQWRLNNNNDQLNERFFHDTSKFDVQNIDSGIIKTVLENRKLNELFKEHCRKELSVENILFYEDINYYKTIDDESKRNELIHIYFDKYMNSDAIEQVNLPSNAIDKLNVDLMNNNIKIDTLDYIQYCLMMNLLDSFQRFYFSTEYKYFVNDLNLSFSILKDQKII
jgi:hypothetical protein